MLVNFDTMTLIMTNEDRSKVTGSYDLVEFDGRICICVNYNADSGAYVYESLPPEIQKLYETYLIEKHLLDGAARDENIKD